MLVGIDAGHGGHDEGGSFDLETGGRLVEKELTLKLARNLQKKLGPQAILSRAEDESLSFKEREKRLAGAGLIICLHFDKYSTSVPKGTKVFWMSPGAKKVADQIAFDLEVKFGRKARAVYPQPKEYPRVRNVISAFSAPTVLIETAFLSNSEDRLYVMNGCPKFCDAIQASLKGLGII
jgi:N-acetylmuramoyl-L-alanine amidase